MLFHFLITYLCKAEFSLYMSAKPIFHNRVNVYVFRMSMMTLKQFGKMWKKKKKDKCSKEQVKHLEKYICCKIDLKKLNSCRFSFKLFRESEENENYTNRKKYFSNKFVKTKIKSWKFSN